MKRDLFCGQVRMDHLGRSLSLAGWVFRRRDLGALIFIELRDRSGVVQVVFNPQENEEAYRAAKSLRPEFVAHVEGRVAARAAGTVNPNLATGGVEIHASRLVILNESKTPPFPIEDDVNVSDDLRLKFRYLDLRRPRMQRNLILRHQAVLAARKFLDEQGFIEVETPMLTKSTPEGARDYLVPSRVNPGKFYALPQSPQLFKQLLMVSGYERYFQIARCFRDEDLRAERQPEFTQLDLEMSFVERDDVIAMVESLVQKIFEAAGVNVPLPILRLKHEEAMDRYGSDKPDLRFGCELRDVTTWSANTGFRIFQQSESIKAMVAPGCGRYSRKDIDNLEARAKEFGAAGLIWVKRSSDGFQSSILKAVGEEKIRELWQQTGAAENDLVLLVSGARGAVNAALGQLRLHLARQEKWISRSDFSFVWITDFPLFEYDAQDGRYVSVNHPFTAPMPEWKERMESQPGEAKAQAYDIVCNGYEIGGGSIRIHDAAVQESAFRVLNLTRDEAYEKFGFLLEALQYGAPPHGGIALGVDRIAMLLSEEESIREVIAFPKTSSAQCLMTESPSPVSERQLSDLHIRLRES